MVVITFGMTLRIAEAMHSKGSRRSMMCSFLQLGPANHPILTGEDIQIAMPLSARTLRKLLVLVKYIADPDSFYLLCRVMLVGWGGNNGSTVTAGILANKK
jgi:hypothetical protein